jgi:hypothetical protein
MADSDYYELYDFLFVTGDYVRRSVLFEDPDPGSPDPENPVMIPRDFTGWTARAQVRANTKRETEILATFTVTVGFVDPTDGYIILELPELESEKCIKKCGWDLELTNPAGEAETVLGGFVISKLDYTR